MAGTIDAKTALSLIAAKTKSTEQEAIRHSLDEDYGCTPAEHTRICRTRNRLAQDPHISLYRIGRRAA